MSKQAVALPADRPNHAPSRKLWIATLCLLAAAALVRCIPTAGFVGMGFDEALYRDYVIKLDQVGLIGYPAICAFFLEDQRQPEQITKLPPTRFLYVFAGWAWKRLEFGNAPPATPGAPRFTETDPALISLHRVSCFFSILTVAVCGLAAARMLGPQCSLPVVALVAFTPTQIHMAQHALIDGFFAFWALLCLWLLWENLRHPGNVRLLFAYGTGLALMVMTKENSFFVAVALCALIASNRWTRCGTVTRELLAVTFLGPLAGLTALIVLAGGVAPFAEIYQLLVSKAQNLTYAIKTGDGPWHRYLVDMMIVNPLILCLALGGLFTQLKRERALLYLALFVGFTYAIMCNVRYAMNLRYATIWDLSLCALAAAQVRDIARNFGRYHTLAATLMIAGICAYGLRQYLIFFADFALYELVTEGLLRAVKILK